ncbi:MAG: DRTGG domain-containing protein [Sphaerochaetaceae bacterium]|jgi:predicted transcriptional regulator
MKFREVIQITGAKLVCGESHLEQEVRLGFASDLMSDVLTLLEDDILLITGLSNNQSIRTAEMSDIANVLLVRNKFPSQTMIEMANELDIALACTPFSAFKTSALLYNAGLKPVY